MASQKDTLNNPPVVNNNEEVCNGNDLIDKVSLTEVYLIDSNGDRVKRICGYPVKDGKVCKWSAGSGTVHVGVGLCRHHDDVVARTTHNNIEASQILSSGYGKELRDRLIEADLNKNLYDSFNPEIEVLYAMLIDELAQEKSTVKFHKVKEIIKQLVKVKQVRSDIQSRALYTKEDLFNACRLILDICRIRLDTTAYEQLLGTVQVAIGQKIPEIDYEEVKEDDSLVKP